MSRFYIMSHIAYLSHGFSHCQKNVKYFCYKNTWNKANKPKKKHNLKNLYK